MKEWWQKTLSFRLLLVVFGAGAAVMTLELAGSRVVAPYFGTSMITWTSLIGVIMASLACGYYCGGLLADRLAQLKVLSFILLTAAIAVLWVSWSSLAILPKFSTWKFFIFNNLLISLIMFAPASFILAMVSPYAVKLSQKDLKDTGRLVGKISALSTCGSIIGTFLTGFVLIPLMGTRQLLFLLAAALLLLALIIWSGSKKLLGLLLIVFAFSSLINYYQAPLQSVLADINTVYNRVWVADLVAPEFGPRPIRLMHINNEWSSAMFLDSDELVFPYTEFYDLGEHFSPNFKNALLIGGAGYSYAKHFLTKYPKANLDVVEIDPGLTEIAKKYFRLKDDERLKIIHEDARLYLNNNTKKYDVIYGDAFVSLSLPFHLTTKESVSHIYNNLSDEGVALVNIISSLEGPKSHLIWSEYATFKAIFPQVYILAVNSPDDKVKVQNIMLIALKSDKLPSWQSNNKEFQQYFTKRYQGEITPAMILTDNWAPVEFFTARTMASN